MLLNGQCSVIGETQTGKTTGAVALLKQQPGLKLFINTKWEKKWEKAFHVTSHSFDRIIDFFDGSPHYRPSWTFNYYPDRDSGYRDIDEMCEYLIRRAQSELDFECCVLFDEVYNMVSKSQRKHKILNIFTMGLGLGVKGIAVGQRPQQINNDILANTEFWVVYYLPQASFELLEDFGVSTPYEKLDWKTKPHKHPENPRRSGWCYVPHHFYVQNNAHDGLKRTSLR